jgi:hypothetical protein
MKKRYLFALPVALVFAVAPAAAHATPEPPAYVLVAWTIPGGDTTHPFAVPQTLLTSVELETPTLDALDDLLPCDSAIQIDLYYNNADTDALLAGKVLYGPQNPKEPHAHVVRGDPWKLVTTAPCAVKPKPRPFHDERQEVTCDTVTTHTRDGFYDLDFNPVANVWIERAEPTIATKVPSVAPNDNPDPSCAPTPTPTPEPQPELAETGFDAAPLFGCVALLAAGVALVLYRRKAMR